MDQTKQRQPLQKLNSHSLKNELLKKLTQLIVSIYVVTFFFSCKSLIHFLHTYSFNLQSYITFYVQQLFTFDRKHVFIICNGIVLFLGLYTYKSSSSDSDQYPTDAVQSNNLQLVSCQDPSPEGGFVAGKISSTVDLNREEEEVQVQDKFITSIVEDKMESELLHLRNEKENMLEITDQDKKVAEDRNESKLLHQRNEKENMFKITQDKKEVVDQDLEQWLSHEELDRKYDDFIRMIKRDIRSESLQQQLILYN